MSIAIQLSYDAKLNLIRFCNSIMISRVYSSNPESLNLQEKYNRKVWTFISKSISEDEMQVIGKEIEKRNDYGVDIKSTFIELNTTISDRKHFGLLEKEIYNLLGEIYELDNSNVAISLALSDLYQCGFFKNI